MLLPQGRPAPIALLAWASLLHPATPAPWSRLPSHPPTAPQGEAASGPHSWSWPVTPCNKTAFRSAPLASLLPAGAGLGGRGLGVTPPGAEGGVSAARGPCPVLGSPPSKQRAQRGRAQKGAGGCSPCCRLLSGSIRYFAPRRAALRGLVVGGDASAQRLCSQAGVGARAHQIPTQNRGQDFSRSLASCWILLMGSVGSPVLGQHGLGATCPTGAVQSWVSAALAFMRFPG